MTVTEAVESRVSCRAYLPTPVPTASLRAILDTARRTPSGGNLQPWHVYALTGEPLAELLAAVRGKLFEHPRGEGFEYNVYPPGLGEPYRARRFKCGEDMYATIGVTREDKPARLRQFARTTCCSAHRSGSSSSSTDRWGLRSGPTSACTCRP